MLDLKIKLEMEIEGKSNSSHFLKLKITRLNNNIYRK